MLDAKAGNPSIPALQACMRSILQLASLDGEQTDALRGYIEAAHLQGTFVIP